MEKKIYLIIAYLLFSKSALAISFIFPVPCQLNHSCYIQQYVDHQPQLNGRDFKGGQLASAHYPGTDIAIASFKAMAQNIPVLAVADGKVIAIKNQSSDNTRMNFTELSSNDCGNTVTIQHTDGWQTQYCHLKQKSVRVNTGQQVKAGEVIAAIGSSGQADYPALELVVKQNDNIIDPFAEQLWQPPIDYQGTGIIDMGISLSPPTYVQLMKSPIYLNTFSITDTVIYPWIRLFGVQADDQQRFVFYDNKNELYTIATLPPINQFYPSWFAYAKLEIATKIGVEQTGNWKVLYQLKQGEQDWQTVATIPFSITFYTQRK